MIFVWLTKKVGHVINTNRFELSLSGLLTRVWMSDERIRIHAPDVLAALLISVVAALVLTPALLWNWQVTLALFLSALLTARMRVTVSRGHVRLVRSVLFLPWCVRTYGASAYDVSIDADGSHLRVGDEDWPACVLSTGFHVTRTDELRAIHAACARLLS
jgi:hypothetical protein